MEKQIPQLSVIVPAYNVERFLDKCLASICTQTFGDLEVLLINDGSSDRTLEICQTWAARDPRIQLITQERSGVSVMRNVGLRAAKGRYLMFVDADDYLEKNAVELLLALKARTGAQISSGRFVREDVSGNPLHTRSQLGDVVISGVKAYEKALFDIGLHSYTWAKIFDRELFEGVEYPEGEILEDYQINFKVFLRAQRLAATRRVIYHYVVHPKSIMNDPHAVSLRERVFMKAVFERYLHAQESKILTRRSMALLRVKSIRRIVRTVYHLRAINEAQLGSAEFENARQYISQIYGHEVEERDLAKLWRWTATRKILYTLFYWA